MNKEHVFPYKWKLADGYPAKGITKHGLKVFGTFVCGGGSTMGYKLAGYEHLGGVEIDPPIAEIYKTNHNPKYMYNEDIREFNKRTDLPAELYDLDLLDGSPPCSTFSMAGSREKGWGKEKVFREGQTMQTLDDLVFVYCETIIKLQPKTFILENVKGIILGNAKAYAKAIVLKMTKAGYNVQVFCLNAASMGVPQKRERVFFIGYKNDLKFPDLKLEFNENNIIYGEFKSDILGIKLTEETISIWKYRIKSDQDLATIHLRIGNKKKRYQLKFVHDSQTPNTLVAGPDSIPIRFDQPNRITMDECKMIGSYPIDFDFNNIHPNYLIGMSVPPVMTAQIANQIYQQWFKLHTNPNP